MKLFKKLENLFSAAAFAEEGEFETARQMVAEDASEPRRAPAAGDIKPAAPRIKHGHLAPKA